MSFICVICKYECDLDDAVAPNVSKGTCVCLRCYTRETVTDKPMPPALRKELVAALAD